MEDGSDRTGAGDHGRKRTVHSRGRSGVFCGSDFTSEFQISKGECRGKRDRVGANQCRAKRKSTDDNLIK